MTFVGKLQKEVITYSIEYILWYGRCTAFHFIMVYLDGGWSWKPKHVASYCKQKGIFVPIRFCPLCEISTFVSWEKYDYGHISDFRLHSYVVLGTLMRSLAPLLRSVVCNWLLMSLVINLFCVKLRVSRWVFWQGTGCLHFWSTGEVGGSGWVYVRFWSWPAVEDDRSVFSSDHLTRRSRSFCHRWRLELV